MIIPLSLGQEDYIARNPKLNRAFVFAYRITGSLDLQSLERAIFHLLKANQALRCRFDHHSFIQNNAHSVQQISRDFPTITKIMVDDFGDPSIDASLVEPLDLLNTGPVRVQLLSSNHEEHLLIITISHFVCDAWSAAKVHHDLWSLYFTKVRSINSVNIFSSFVEHIDKEVVRGTRLTNKQLKFWNAMYSRNTQIPSDSTKGSQAASFTLSAQEFSEIRGHARSFGVTPPNLLIALLAATTSFVTGGNGSVLQVLHNGRFQPRTYNLVASTFRAFPVAFDTSLGESLQQYSTQISATLQEAFFNLLPPFSALRVARQLGYDVQGDPKFARIVFNYTVPHSLIIQRAIQSRGTPDSDEHLGNLIVRPRGRVPYRMITLNESVAARSTQKAKTDSVIPYRISQDSSGGLEIVLRKHISTPIPDLFRNVVCALIEHDSEERMGDLLTKCADRPPRSSN